MFKSMFVPIILYILDGFITKIWFCQGIYFARKTFLFLFAEKKTPYKIN